MGAERSQIVPGTELELVTTNGVVVGTVNVESVSLGGGVIARLRLRDVVPRPAELDLLVELAEAADCLALAAMEELEKQLAALGLGVVIPSTGVRLDLRHGFSGIVITEYCERIAFRLREGGESENES